MSLCRITTLRAGFRYQAKSTAGVWRTLSEGDALATGEVVEVRAGGTCYGVEAYRLQNRVSGSWADALSVSLDLDNGDSVTRKDKLTIAGDATDSTVAVALTYDKGLLSTTRKHRAQLHAEDKRGIVFRWHERIWAGVLSVREESNDVGAGGYLPESDARLVANRRQFAEYGLLPVDGQRIVADGVLFEIVGLEVGDAVLSCELRRANDA